MRDELIPIKQAIDAAALPPEGQPLIDPLWDKERLCFHAQETFLLDYKETVPARFSDEYGAGIIRLCLAFHNTFGGIVIFGVRDNDFAAVGADAPLDIESLNRVLTECSGFRGECLSKTYSTSLNPANPDLVILLVPKRGFQEPVRLTRPLGKYQAGTLWMRDRAEALEVRVKNLPLIYSDRLFPPSDAAGGANVSVHRSLPPSPSTVKVFVGREKLLLSLWDWLVFGDQPRLYLHGPGGSGKSTLAFEFARHLTETDQRILLASGEALDYVIYISAKEVELNSLTAQLQPFSLKQFTNASDQFSQIAYHSGLLDHSAIENASTSQVLSLISELFTHFNGLIVIDDIDTLHRRSVDTGEETLLLKALASNKRTRLLYTLRYAPPNVHNSAREVPGLNDDEYFEFVDACSRQFGVRQPDGQHLPLISQATRSLPLLIETVIGLRRYCGNYQDALATFSDKGGEDARRYLYQREYDRLEKDGRSRQVLAGLGLLEEAVSFSTLCNLFQFSREQVRDALNECNSVFLSTVEDQVNGDTLYQLTPPSVPFVRNISEGLPYFDSLVRTVQHFTQVVTKTPPEEAALVVRMERLIRQKRHAEIKALFESLPKDDPVLVNPRIRSFVGQAFAASGSEYRERARESFRAAEGLKHRDVFMMRCWFNLEFSTGYGYLEAERICDRILQDAELTPRIRSEFLSKKASCLFQQALPLVQVNRDKATGLLKQSIASYLDALWVGATAQDLDTELTLSWLERPVQRFMSLAAESVDDVFLLLEALADSKHDVHEEGIRMFMDYLLHAPIPANRREVQNRLKGLCTRTTKKINTLYKPLKDNPGFNLVVETLDDIRQRIEEMGKN